MSEPIVIYHANCMDGFASACVVAKYLNGRGEYVACRYGDPPPNVDGREVFVVDFSWKLPEMLELVERSARLHWYDHHATSAGYAGEVLAAQMAKPGATDPGKATLHVHRQDACGALLTWGALYDSKPPDVLRYVDDRDRWLWKLDGSREINAALNLIWSPRWGKPEAWWPALLGEMTAGHLHTGRAVLAAQSHRVAAKCRERAHAAWMDGPRGSLPVMAINTDSDISETGHELCTEHGADVAVMYFYNGAKWVHSLRSRSDVDVSVIAKHYGGGGHPQAAGFTCERLVVR